MALRRARQPSVDAAGPSKSASAPSACRPTPAEECEALDVICMMRSMEQPLLGARAPAKANVVACAIALLRGERFDDDRQALRLFGAHPETKVRELWVDGKLASFIAAGGALPSKGGRGKGAGAGEGGKGGRGASVQRSYKLPFDELRRRLEEGLTAAPGEPQAAWNRRVYCERVTLGVPVGEYLEFLHGKPLPGSVGAVPAFLLDRDEHILGRYPSAPSYVDAEVLRAKFPSGGGWVEERLRELARVEH